jgi:hypothetical protein
VVHRAVLGIDVDVDDLIAVADDEEAVQGAGVGRA